MGEQVQVKRVVTGVNPNKFDVDKARRPAPPISDRRRRRVAKTIPGDLKHLRGLLADLDELTEYYQAAEALAKLDEIIEKINHIGGIHA